MEPPGSLVPNKAAAWKVKCTVIGSYCGSSWPSIECTSWLNHAWPPVKGRIGSMLNVKATLSHSVA